MLVVCSVLHGGRWHQGVNPGSKLLRGLFGFLATCCSLLSAKFFCEMMLVPRCPAAVWLCRVWGDEVARVPLREGAWCHGRSCSAAARRDGIPSQGRGGAGSSAGFCHCGHSGLSWSCWAVGDGGVGAGERLGGPERGRVLGDSRFGLREGRGRQGDVVQRWAWGGGAVELVASSSLPACSEAVINLPH